MEDSTDRAPLANRGSAAHWHILLAGLLVLSFAAAALLSGLTIRGVTQFSFVFLAALAAAFLMGSLGSGFGALLVPSLILLQIEPRVAVASSLISQVVVVPLGGTSHASLGHVRTRIVAPLLAAGILGTLLGAQFSVSISDFLLKILIAVSTAVMGILVLILGNLDRNSELKDENGLPRRGLLLVGLVAGFAASAFGTGWGPVGVSLLLLMGMVPRLAIGSSLTARAPVALSATIAYLLLGSPQRVVELNVLAPILAGGALGVLAGSAVTRRVDDRWLRQAFGVVIVALSILLLAEAQL